MGRLGDTVCGSAVVLSTVVLSIVVLQQYYDHARVVLQQHHSGVSLVSAAVRHYWQSGATVVLEGNRSGAVLLPEIER